MTYFSWGGNQLPLEDVSPLMDTAEVDLLGRREDVLPAKCYEERPSFAHLGVLPSYSPLVKGAIVRRQASKKVNQFNTRTLSIIEVRAFRLSWDD